MPEVVMTKVSYVAPIFYFLKLNQFGFFENNSWVYKSSGGWAGQNWQPWAGRLVTSSIGHLVVRFPDPLQQPSELGNLTSHLAPLLIGERKFYKLSNESFCRSGPGFIIKNQFTISSWLSVSSLNSSLQVLLQHWCGHPKHSKLQTKKGETKSFNDWERANWWKHNQKMAKTWYWGRCNFFCLGLSFSI